MHAQKLHHSYRKYWELSTQMKTMLPPKGKWLPGSAASLSAHQNTNPWVHALTPLWTAPIWLQVLRLENSHHSGGHITLYSKSMLDNLDQHLSSMLLHVQLAQAAVRLLKETWNQLPQVVLWPSYDLHMACGGTHDCMYKHKISNFFILKLKYS